MYTKRVYDHVQQPTLPATYTANNLHCRILKTPDMSLSSFLQVMVTPANQTLSCKQLANSLQHETEEFAACINNSLSQLNCCSLLFENALLQCTQADHF